MVSRRAVLMGLGGALLASSAGVGYAVGIEPYWLRVTRYRISPRGWPRGLHLKVAVLADLHICEPFMPLGQVEAIVATTNALGADVVTLLGDYAGDHFFVREPVPLRHWTRALARLEAPFGVHAVLGNHDWWDDHVVMRRRTGRPRIELAMKDAGIPLYENEAVRLVKDGRAFWIGGLGDQWAFPRRRRGSGDNRRGGFDGVDDVAGLMGRITDDAPLIMMAHEPDVFAGLTERASLTLAGHMHGGQVRIAGYCPSLPSRFGERYRYGHIVEDGRHMIVSGGLGCSMLPVRIGAPPEIVLVEISAEGTTPVGV